MMTLYYFAHATAGIVLGLVILITCLRKLINRGRPKASPQPRLPSERWSAPSRTAGAWWRN
jgi:hypothetical protein